MPILEFKGSIQHVQKGNPTLVTQEFKVLLRLHHFQKDKHSRKEKRKWSIVSTSKQRSALILSANEFHKF